MRCGDRHSGARDGAEIEGALGRRRRGGTTTIAPVPENGGPCCAVSGGSSLPAAPESAEVKWGWDAAGAFLWATGGYRLRPYAGQVSLLLSTELAGADNPHNPTARWRRLAPRLEVRELRGNHLACLTDHVADLGAVMRECLEGRPRGGPPSRDAG